jgi:hypothetical protein
MTTRSPRDPAAAPARNPAPASRLRILRRPSESIRPAMPRPQRRDCQGRLAAVLLDYCGTGASLVAATSRPWCSATFIGAQHRLTLRLADDAEGTRAGTLAAALPDAEFALPGHIVADLAVDAVRSDGEGGALVDLAVLTIEDW